MASPLTIDVVVPGVVMTRLWILQELVEAVLDRHDDALVDAVGELVAALECRFTDATRGRLTFDVTPIDERTLCTVLVQIRSGVPVSEILPTLRALHVPPHAG